MLDGKKAPDATAKLDTLDHLIGCLREYEEEITEALVYGGDMHDFEYVCKRVLSESLITHDFGDAIALCEIWQTETAKAYHIYIACGDLDTLIEAQRHELHDAAISAGCSAMTFAGRMGWLRALKDEGWKPLNVTMMRPL